MDTLLILFNLFYFTYCYIGSKPCIVVFCKLQNDAHEACCRRNKMHNHQCQLSMPVSNDLEGIKENILDLKLIKIGRGRGIASTNIQSMSPFLLCNKGDNS